MVSDKSGALFGEGVKRLREERGWTQEDLAEKARLSRTAIPPLERGQRQPRGRTTDKLASAFGLTRNEFLTACSGASQRDSRVQRVCSILREALETDFDFEVQKLMYDQSEAIADALTPNELDTIFGTIEDIAPRLRFLGNVVDVLMEALARLELYAPPKTAIANIHRAAKIGEFQWLELCGALALMLGEASIYEDFVTYIFERGLVIHLPSISWWRVDYYGDDDTAIRQLTDVLRTPGYKDARLAIALLVATTTHEPLHVVLKKMGITINNRSKRLASLLDDLKKNGL